ncbi:MAG TPA: hypothetical protein VF137_08350 [Candidatus Dormibacteraeota bacterium]
MSAAIVTTTIYVPKLLENYIEDAVAGGHGDTRFIVIGDRKTPPEAKSYSAGLAAEHGVSLEFQDPDDQVEYLERYPELLDHLPWNSIQRRNIGLLRAYELGCDPIITIDDDNFLLDRDFVGLHSLAGRSGRFAALGSDTGWADVCQELEEIRGVPFYHRGFPPGERWKPSQNTWSEREGRVVVNAGLWLGDPDVDALQRLVYPIEAVRYKRDQEPNFALAEGSWSPFNSQNTALAREIMPAYFLSPRIGRFDDIWASYVICRIAEHRGDLIAYGKPVVRQDRNPHDYWKDMDMEREPWRVTDRLCARLREIQVTGDDYAAGLDAVIAGLEEWVRAPVGLNEQESALVDGFVAGLRVWRGTIARVA